MKVRNLALLIVAALLLPSCSDNPYSSMGSNSLMMVEKDIGYLEMYEKTLCGIKKKHEWEEITRGKCLALYYDFKGNDRVQNGKKEVTKRVSYVLNNPDKFDSSFPARLSDATMKIGVCTNYIKKNCM